ncbi:hypothetical protein [uncultured Pseudomonas sp.]|uniref:hypothetical protein n=1 Tax=uncultured Pseudomonas sp. TaxID=114707 RepID=UPI002611F71B|nr:hypothetical protein [uncultured Pseudomonas sp.]
MIGEYLFSVEAKHEFVNLPHFGPFLTATAAGQAVDSLMARFDGLSIRMHVLPSNQSDELEAKEQECIYQLECACSGQSGLSVVEPLVRAVVLPGPEEALQIASDHGFKACEIGYLKADEGFLLLRVHIVTSDLQKAITATRWRRRELADRPESPKVVIMTMPIPMLTES